MTVIQRPFPFYYVLDTQAERSYVTTDGTIVFCKDVNKLYILKSSTWIDIGTSGGMSDLVDDTTPQLGGNLDGQAFNISTLGNITAHNLNIDNWNIAYSWGNHADFGYLTSLAFAGLSDYPADAAGALTNDGAGALSWVAYLTSVAFADLSDYPVDAAGVLTNDGAGALSWESSAIAFADLTDYPADAHGFLHNDGAGALTWEAAAAGYTDLTEFVDQTAWRLFYSDTDGDVIEFAFGTAGKVLTSGGASAAPTWETPAAAGVNKTFYSTGSGNWTAPAGVTIVFVTMVGGGGGGAGSTGGGGGGGMSFVNMPHIVVPANNYAYAVGAGGAASTSTGNGNSGVDTTFDTLTALAGVRGLADGTGGLGGGSSMDGSDANRSIPGNKGHNGGKGGGTSGTNYGGPGGGSIFGIGGIGGSSGEGAAGTGYGAGGGAGGGNNAGAAGTDGFILIVY